MVLRLEGVKKSFRNSEELVPVLQGVSFELEAGDTLALRGESGSGKSTLLHIAGALEAADAGRVWVSGKELTQLKDGERAQLRRTDIALIFQQFNLIPSLTVSANIAFQSALSGTPDLVHKTYCFRFGLRRTNAKISRGIIWWATTARCYRTGNSSKAKVVVGR